MNRVEIFLFIDALGWDLVKETGFLADVLPERRPAQMQFGYSCTAIPTILTGKTPAEHGHLGIFRFAPKDSPFRSLSRFGWLFQPASFWNRGRVRHWLSKIIKKLYGYTGYFQLYQIPFSKLSQMDYTEKRNMFIAGGMEQIGNLWDMLEASGVPFHISDWHLGDERNLALAHEAIADGKQFLFLYTAELDSLLHAHVGNMSVIRKKLDWYQERICSILETCKKQGKDVHFTIFSDHGMTPLTHTANIMAAVEKTGLVFGQDYGACYDSTMFRVTYLKPRAKEKIEAALAVFQDQGHWLTVEEEKRYGIYREDRYFGDALFLMNAGIQIVPSDLCTIPLNGMHGFLPEDRYSLASILSNRPIPDTICSVADYFRFMKESMEALKAI